MRPNVFSLVLLGSLCSLGLPSRADAQCSDTSLNGRYAWRTDATLVNQGAWSGVRKLIAVLHFHGDGSYSNEGYTMNNNGQIVRGTLDAFYVVNADCTGKILMPDGVTELGDIVVLEDGSEFFMLKTNPASEVLLGVGTRIHNRRKHERKER